MILQGASRADILHYASGKSDWGVEERQVENYMTRARQLVSKEAATYRAEAMDTAIARLNMIIANAMSIQDYQRAIAGQREINQLLGLYAPQKIHVDDWRSQAIADIRAGKLPYAALKEWFDDSMAAELFREAGVKIEADGG